MSTIESIISVQLPTGGEAQVTRHRYQGAEGLRAVVVAGIRGDTPEGMRVAFSLASSLKELEEHLSGTVDLYPCVNPLAAEHGSRHWPFFDVDLNRLFPGKANGHPPDRVAAALVKDISGADVVIELRGARSAFQESTQALVSSDKAAELAMNINVKVVWQRQHGPAAPKTFAYQFPNSIVLEGGSGNRLTESVGREFHDGVLNVLATQKILPEDKLPFSWMTIERPIMVNDQDVIRVRSGRSGLFLPETDLESTLKKGDLIGRIIDPSTATLRAEIRSPCSGWIMALRNQPVVSPGIMVARVLRREAS